ncbi:hypothetical protein [Arthrobacter sp. Ld5]|uniref:hypothetical protein n=1 Tax=Arthrobacter sp. Ld5 TaxID=649152 RepID=UPI003EBDACF8
MSVDPDTPVGPDAPTDPDSPTATAALTAWTSVLDTLEAALETALRTALDAAAVDDAPAGTSAVGDLQRQAAVLTGWIPPRVDGPIPAPLVARARRISERQREALAQLAADADTLRRHRSALGSVHAATAPQQSAVYLDVTG